MDILRKSLAPITDEAWEQINDMAQRTLKAGLSARKFVEVDGPKGWDYGAVPLGRLEVGSKQSKAVADYGVRTVLPLVEPRVKFELDIWELDNAARGAEDVDLGSLEEAARKIALFEEKAVYQGFSAANIKGLKDSSSHKPITFSGDVCKTLDTVSQAITRFNEAAVEGPYVLVAGPTLWRAVSSHEAGYPLKSHVEKLVGNPIILNPFLEETFLVSIRGGDMKLTVGQDHSIGFNSATSTRVQLYFTESFSFQVLDGVAIIPIQWRKK